LDQSCAAIAEDIRSFSPDVVISGSRGGIHMLRLWETQVWCGPHCASVMINAHPSLRADSLPSDTPIVIAQGSRDELDGWSNFTRGDLETIIRDGTGTRRMCYLYYTGDSGCVLNAPGATVENEHPSGFKPGDRCDLTHRQHGRTHTGDGHNMQTLLKHDCLCRLIDAAASGVPELYMMRTWAGMLSSARREAEVLLGYHPKEWTQKFPWSDGDSILAEVHSGTEEFEAVKAIFLAQPCSCGDYAHVDYDMFDEDSILKIERVQCPEVEGRTEQCYGNIRKKLACMLTAEEPFEGHLFNSWLFHGLHPDNLLDVLNNGFDPIVGDRQIWGKGVYFARDAQMADGYATADDDNKKRLILTLVVTGIPTSGNWGFKRPPKLHGFFPYSSMVDRISNPEVFVSSAKENMSPAYVITYDGN